MKRTSRKPSNLSESLHQRLNSYALAASAAGVSLLALTQAAEAKIVYHHAHHHIEPNSNYKLDLNHDGIADFIFKNLYGSQSGGALSLNVPFVRENEAVWATSAGYLASALPAGIRVSSKAPFGYASSDQMAAIMNTSGQTSGVGPWCGVRNRYLGLKFTIGSSTHFGWARLSVACLPSGIFGTLTGYAYETIPLKPIITGKTHGGASLGALAAGSTALSGRRHKIRSK